MHAHFEDTKPHATDDLYRLGRVMELRAGCGYMQREFEDAKSGTLRASIDAFEKSGAMKRVGDCRTPLREIEEAVSPKMDPTGKFLGKVPLLASVNSPFPA